MKRSFLLLWIVLWHFLPANAQTINVNFGKWIDNPLVKGKFDVYQTPLIQSSRLLKHCQPLNEIGIQNLRYEVGWGKTCELNYPQIQGSSPDFSYNFSGFDLFLDSLRKYNVKPLLAMGYTPGPLKVNNNEMNMFTDLEGWQKINRDYAFHFKEKAGKSCVMYEIWNEPDFTPVFFTGTFQDYQNIYRYAVKGLREGDPEAIVGGPAIAWTTGWLDGLLKMTRDENLPIDFISAHSYGDPAWVVNNLRNSLANYPNPHLPLLVTEYGSYPTNGSMCLGSGCNQERFMSAMWFFRDANIFLTYPDLTNVYWAQWTDVEVTGNGTNWYPGGDKLGLITLDNHKKALFNAFKIYYQLPVDRCYVAPASVNEIFAIASADPDNAGVVIWNTSTTTEKSVAINLGNIPFASGSLEVFRIDEINGSYIDRLPGEKLMPLSGESRNIQGNNDKWIGKIPAQSLVYLKLRNNNNKSLLDPCSIGSFNRHLYWFTDRNKSSYAVFDKITSIARVGTGISGEGYGIIGAQYDSIISNIHIQVKKDGDFKALDDNSIFGIRFDFFTGKNYTKSLYIHGGIYSNARTTPFPFGTMQLPDKELFIEDFNNNKDFTINLKSFAPSDWTGKVIVSFEIQNTGIQTRAAIYLSEFAREIGTVSTIKKNIKPEKTLSIFPNPTNNEDFQIDLTGFKSKPVDLHIMNVIGQQCFQRKAEFNDILSISSNQFKNGIYIVVAKSGNNFESAKLVIN